MILRTLIRKDITKLPEYFIWKGMIDRCNNINNTSYKYYGKRGINVCSAWLTSFEKFYMDMGNCPSNKHSIERIDNTKNYYKNNCKWATSKEQARNKRTTITVVYEGISKPLATWCEELNLDYSRTLKRIKRGYSIKVAFELPIQK